MDGVLVVDKPQGLTSHDVVAVARRAARREAHRPHRHARSAGHRRAAAGVRPRHAARAVPHRVGQGLRGDDPLRRHDRHLRRHRRRRPAARERAPTRDALDDGARVADAASYLQMPPAYSAKKVGGDAPTSWRGATSRSTLAAGAGARHARWSCSTFDGDRRRVVAHLLGRLLRAVARPRPRASCSARAPASRRCGGRGAASSRSTTRCRSTPWTALHASEPTGRGDRLTLLSRSTRCCRRCRPSRVTGEGLAPRVARPASVGAARSGRPRPPSGAGRVGATARRRAARWWRWPRPARPPDFCTRRLS